MHERDDRIHDPYGETYKWIMEDESTSSKDNDASPHSSIRERDDTIDSPADDSDDEYRGESVLYGSLAKERQSSRAEDEKKRRIMMMQSREKFLDWVSSSDGIFHVTGKLGSGKSTLMKFLSTHSRTEAGLTKWAGKLQRVNWNTELCLF